MDKKIRCSHILQKHSQSRRPFDSYRNKPVTRSPEEALENIKTIHEEITKNGIETFGQYASKYSECGSAANEGDLGLFGKGEMQKEFEETGYALQVGQLSDPIQTASGVHIILRTA